MWVSKNVWFAASGGEMETFYATLSDRLGRSVREPSEEEIVYSFSRLPGAGFLALGGDTRLCFRPAFFPLKDEE